jgi:large subunit ribosomal protein L25
MSRPSLNVRERSVHGKHVSHLRREGILPGIVYGPGVPSQPIEFDAHEFEALHRIAGRNAVVDLHLDGGKPQPVLLQAVQEHPVTRRTLHVDFLVVNMEEERTVDVGIVAAGHSEAVDRMGGILLHLRDAVQVRAKPADLPSAIELDITPLIDFDAVVHASELHIPPGVTLITPLEEALARVQPPRREEVFAPPTEEVEGEAEAAAGEGEAAPEGEGTAASATEASEPAEQ